MSKRKRNDLSLADKAEVIKMKDQRMSQIEISKKYGCSQSLISRIIAQRETIMRDYTENKNPERKRRRLGKETNVEDALWQWFTNVRSHDVPLSGPTLQEKAEKLAFTMGNTEFKATDGWLSRWKERHSISLKKAHGEKAAADQPAADDWVTTKLPALLENYQPNDIYNADETGIFYRATPDKSLAHKSEKLAGGKKSMDRITALVAVNMTGTDKRPLFIIGKSKNPRCFRGAAHLPVTYRNNHNA